MIDAAFGVVHDGWQRSVFASGRLPLDPTRTQVGPISIEITEPLRVNRVRVDAAGHGITADLTFRARTAAFSEPRQTLLQGTRPVGQPAPAAPARTAPQIFFLWAPVNFADTCLHYMTFEDADGRAWAKTAAVLPVIGPDAPVYGPDAAAELIADATHQVHWARGLRRSEGATLTLSRNGRPETVQLDPLLTFRMRGAGYLHPVWAHGRWHDELTVAAEEHRVDELDTLDPSCVHVQQVMRASWASSTGSNRTGLGVLEQLVIGPHTPSGFHEMFDGAGIPQPF